MKKSLFLLVAALLVMQSCSRDYIPLDEKIAECYLTKVPITDDEYSVSMDDIEEYIATFYSGYKVNSITEKYLIDDIMVYVVEFDYGGWVIMSSDKRLCPVLAYSDSGKVTMRHTENQGLKIWIQNIFEVLANETYLLSEECKSNLNHWNRVCKRPRSINQTEVVPGEIWVKRRNSLVSSQVLSSSQRGPLTTTKWGQESPWNFRIPYNLYTGCVAVALAQILYFNNTNYNTPNGLYHTLTISNLRPVRVGHSDEHVEFSVNRSNFVQNSPRWSEMKLCDGGEGNSSYVADLMLDIGDRVNMVYYLSGSSSYINDAVASLPFYSLQGEIDGYSLYTAKSEIDGNRVLYISGYSENSLGHAWVIDGYNTSLVQNTYEYVWLVDGNQYEGELYTREEVQAFFPGERLEDGMLSYESEVVNRNYVSMNWGNDGENDGFYLHNMGLDVTYNCNMNVIKGIRPAVE